VVIRNSGTSRRLRPFIAPIKKALEGPGTN
jgi:hypothetical protein